MKYRKGFVTNSSSSSFIVNIKGDIPKKYKNCFKKITKDNLLSYFLNKNYIDEDDKLSYNFSNEQVKSLLDIDDNILILMKFIKCDSSNFEDYLLLLEKFKENPNLELYEYFADWDWEFDKDDLREYLETCDIIISD